MKPILCCLFILTLTPGVSFCQDSTSSDIEVNFTVPKGWNAEGDSVYVRMNYKQEFTYWNNELRAGHMPWRADPKNIAVTCLWSFGIHDGSPVFAFADRLTEIKRGSVYSFNADSIQYSIYVRTKDEVPIAFRFTVRDYRKKAAITPPKGVHH